MNGAGRHDLVVVSSRIPAEPLGTGRRPARWAGEHAAWAGALGPALAARNGAWVGWNGRADNRTSPVKFQAVALHPVALSATDVADHLEGQCASTIVPLYHDAVERPAFHRRWRRAYRSVNERYAAATAAVAAPGAAVWVHGHELQLVPTLLRAARPDLTIGCYLPLPVPPVELFGRMPMRSEIVDGLLGADAIRVPDRRSAGNLVRLASDLGGYEVDDRVVIAGGRRVVVDALPMGADVDTVEQLAAGANVRRRMDNLRRELRQPRAVLLAVDRLDATSGAEQRLTAFGELLADRRLHATDCMLVQVVVPAARQSAEQAAIRTRVEQLVARINGTHSAVGRPAVHYVHRNLDPVDLVALFRLADVFLATSLRDGANPTAKAFVAARLDNTGVLVLSEFSGVAGELTEATMVNPYDVEDLKRAIAAAADPRRATAEEAAMRRMRQSVRRYDARWWAGRMLAVLDTCRPANPSQQITATETTRQFAAPSESLTQPPGPPSRSRR
ncbi:trehalose-6-phosphate synthase [Dactylosporangium sp. NPDC048998]|uniref:alpha,alpha-trehalose-phosphate synthase (UDP-forming) n=1 Tax=Dactylosporangium sp. NPDC048998 TaxID=3363976 RepID=UPI0037178722